MEIRQLPSYREFLNGIKDATTKAKILVAVSRLKAGNPGKAKSVGDGVSELKIDYGPGWRIYYTQVGNEIVLLLTGGSKNGQQRDIEVAKKMAAELRKK